MKLRKAGPTPAPRTTFRLPFRLDVSYRTRGPRSYDWGSLDEPIERAAYRRAVGTGTELLGAMVRDLQFEFGSKASRNRAVLRMRALRRILRIRLQS